MAVESIGPDETQIASKIGYFDSAASVSGGIPPLIYFQGLHLTRASTAGYFEMMQTLAAVCITWGFFHASLHPHQVIAAIVLIAAVAMVHHVQQQIESHISESSRP